jgi:hypothetical protein
MRMGANKAARLICRLDKMNPQELRQGQFELAVTAQASLTPFPLKAGAGYACASGEGDSPDRGTP